jgi:hypothetical protein
MKRVFPQAVKKIVAVAISQFLFSNVAKARKFFERMFAP